MRLARIFLTLMLFSTASAHAGFVEYQFSALVSGETDPAAPSTTGPQAPTLFAAGTEVVGSFFYDSGTPASSIGVTPESVGLTSDFAPVNLFAGAVTGLSGSIGGTTFTDADNSVALVSDSVAGGPTVLDVFLINTGNTGITPVVSGDFVMYGISVFSVGFFNYLASGDLPSVISLGELNTGVNLLFRNSVGDVRFVQAHGDGMIAAVPNPPTGLMLLSGLVMLFGVNTRKRKVQVQV